MVKVFGEPQASMPSVGATAASASSSEAAMPASACAVAAGPSAAASYGEAVTQAASQAGDYLREKASAVGDKIRGMQQADYGHMLEDAKEYARQNPGQTILISAAAGFLLGLLLRGARR